MACRRTGTMRACDQPKPIHRTHCRRCKTCAGGPTACVTQNRHPAKTSAPSLSHRSEARQPAGSAIARPVPQPQVGVRSSTS
eukprot:5936322-Lingulodinium_polyedra.AAC.1